MGNMHVRSGKGAGAGGGGGAGGGTVRAGRASMSSGGGGGRRDSAEDMAGSMGSPPGSPAMDRSPLMFTPQIPMQPIPRADDFALDGPALGLSGPETSGIAEPQPVATVIRWTHGGSEVYINGTFDGWRTRHRMQRSGKEFLLAKMLLPGVYQYKFIVDGEWRYAPDQPAMYDEQGNVNNVIEVEEPAPATEDPMAAFEQSGSPYASYDNPMWNIDDYAKEPPTVPPHLHLTLLNALPARDSPALLPRPQHVILNHAYVEKSRTTDATIMGVTHRYRSKYVTLVLYKPSGDKLRRRSHELRAQRQQEQQLQLEAEQQQQQQQHRQQQEQQVHHQQQSPVAIQHPHQQQQQQHQHLHNQLQSPPSVDGRLPAHLLVHSL